MSSGNIDASIVIGSDTYDIAVNIPSDSTAPYSFKIADQKDILVGLAIKSGGKDKSDPPKELPEDVFLTVSPPPSILPPMIKSISVSFCNGTYTATSNPFVKSAQQITDAADAGTVAPTTEPAGS